MEGTKITYKKYVEAYREAYSDTKKETQFKNAQRRWNDLKNNEESIQKDYLALKAKANKDKSRSLGAWVGYSSAPKKSKVDHAAHVEEQAGTSSQSIAVSDVVDVVDVTEEGEEETTSDDNVADNLEREKPAQKKLEDEISNLKTQFHSLVTLKQTGLSTVDKKQIDEVKTSIKQKELKLNRLKAEASRQKKRRQKLQEGIQTVSKNDPEAEKLLKNFNRDVTGRPRKELDQPELLSAIVQLVENSSAAHDRRRCEVLRTVTTLDDLVEEIKKLGFSLSRSTLYLRLLPRRGNTSEGKRHVQTVPVKLLRPENNLRKRNEDRMYAKSIVDDMFEIAKLFGPDTCLFLSNDDKARVPLGLACANLQAPILMHMEYQVRLPDHNFVVGERHKLIPSVYGVCKVTPKGDVSYSGDTFIRIRSGKHDGSNAYTHAYDLRQLFLNKEIPTKYILLLESDGAQDEAPRYPKPLASAVSLFK